MRTSASLALLLAVTSLCCLAAVARAEWLAPLTVETAETLPSGQIDLALGASYFHNLRFPPFTPPGFILWQDLTAVPELALRAAVGSRVEIQASYEFLDLNEHTTAGLHSTYGGGDARLFTKIYAVREGTWIPGLGVRFGTKLPNASSTDRLGTNATDFFIQWLASKHIGDFSVHCNLGIALLDEPTGNGQDDLFTYAIGAVSPTLGAHAPGEWGVRFLADVAGTTGSRFNNDGTEIRGGLQVVYDGLTLYAGVGGGLSGAAEDYGFMGGVIYAFDVERLTSLFE
jgi:hypothetical protein